SPTARWRRGMTFSGLAGRHLLGQVRDLGQERVGGGEPEGHTGTDDERSDDQAGGQCDKADNFHEFLLGDLVDVRKKETGTRTKTASACRAPGPGTPGLAS